MDAQRVTTEGASRPLSVLPALILTASARVFFRLSLLAALNWLSPSGRAGGTSTSPPHPLTVFRRALERGNLLIADATATVRCAMTPADLAARGPSLPGRSYRPVIHKAWYPRGTKPQV